MTNKTLLHEPAMAKVRSSKMPTLAASYEKLAKAADESNAARASLTLDWITDGEDVQAEFVPQLTIAVVRPPD